MSISNVSEWMVYILECADNSYYTGITTDLQRRLTEHNGDIKGARYTRMRRPVKLVFQQSFENRSQATRQEYAIKQLSRNQKEDLIANSSGGFSLRRKNN